MGIVTALQMKEAEKTANQNGLSYLHMMERAGSAVAKYLLEQYPKETKGMIAVLAGTGNNGGDGFVAAKKLAEQGVKVCVILAMGEPISELTVQMANRLQGSAVTVVDAKTQGSFVRQLLLESSLVADCVFGTGFHGQLPSSVRELFRSVARMKHPVVGVDLPSGVCADTGEAAEDTLKCHSTVTFHAYKYAHVLYPARGYCGPVTVADIGIPQESLSGLPFVLDETRIKPLLYRPQGDTHKGTFGKAALLVGSKGMSGAATLATKACLRCGAGLVVPVVPESIYPLVAASAPEGVYRIYNESTAPGKVADICMDSTACLAGCGLSVNGFTKSVCRELVLSYPNPLVLDADGINSLAGHIDVLREREGAAVLTPHPGEMARMLKTDIATVQRNRFALAGNFAKEYGVVLVLKGAGTVIASPDGAVAVCLTGNSGMSKGGSGDVLAGMITSFLASGMAPFDSACAAVWLHGKAGDDTARRLSMRGMLPGDMIETLPSLFLKMEEQ